MLLSCAKGLTQKRTKIFHKFVWGCSQSTLTEAGAYPQLPTQPIYHGHSELSHEEKSKFEFEEKKFITESCVFKTETPANFLF